MKLHFRIGDLAAIIAIVLLAVLLFLLFLPQTAATAAWAEIYQNGNLIKTVALSRDGEFTITGDYCNTVTVRDGKIAVTESDCPGKDCVHLGFSGSAGKSIVCLPNGLEIRIVSDDDSVDFIVG